MSRPVIRVGDFHAGHICETYHATAFVTGSLSVLTNGKPTVRFGDVTACTDMVIPIHSSILVGGRPIAVTGSPTSGHLPCYPPTVCAMGSLSVLANVGGL